MSVAGYVLAGGNSTRMGTDKALLEVNGAALARNVALAVQQAAENITLVADPAKYSFLGFPVIPDLRTGAGPLAGIEAALAHSPSEWNLIVACDLAAISADFLSRLCARLPPLGAAPDCLVPVTPEGRLQPLAALYRRRCLFAVSQALDNGTRKVTDVFKSLQMSLLPVAEVKVFQNMNTPEEWNRYLNGRSR